MRETTLDDVCELLETLIVAVNKMNDQVVAAVESAEAAVWDTST